VGEPDPGRRLGDELLIELPDGQIVRCRIVNITDIDTIQVVPEHEVVIGPDRARAGCGPAGFGCVRCHLETCGCPMPAWRPRGFPPRHVVDEGNTHGHQQIRPVQ
jgi:hypothetical protein